MTIYSEADNVYKLQKFHFLNFTKVRPSFEIFKKDVTRFINKLTFYDLRTFKDCLISLHVLIGQGLGNKNLFCEE